MHKWIIAALLAAVGGTAIVKTDLVSYARTLWSKTTAEVKNAIPTKFEIERARNEVAQLDKDIAGMIRPIAEFKAAIGQLDKDIDQGRTNLEARREGLLALTAELEKHAPTLKMGARDVPADKAKKILERDFESFQRLERHMGSLRKLADAKATSLEAAQEQLAKLVSKKREFEVRLAQLEADEETLAVASIGNKIAFDDNRASAIEASLKEIEHRQNVCRAELELSQGDVVSEVSTTKRGVADLTSIRSYLEKR